MPFSFEALQARYGDCLFLTFPGADGGRTRLLVDGGPAGVFRTSLAQRLAKEATGGATLPIDAVLVSHIDEDHVLGLLDMFETIQDANKRHAPWPYKPRFLLHNSFDAIAGEGEGGVARAGSGDTVLASFNRGVAIAGIEDHTSAAVLASYSQGSRLASLAASLKITRNPPDQRLLMLEAPARKLVLGAATLTIVGPLWDEIDDLRTQWKKWKAKQKTTQELAAYLDRSVPNLSSIVALLECENKRVLLTGDARGDKVLTGLERAGLLDQHGAMHVDILKLPHHGSIRNADRDFFERIKADHYVVSGDGTFGNPDRATLEMIADVRAGEPFALHLTYDAASCDSTHEAWRTARNRDFQADRDGISDVVARLRASPSVSVHEGPVLIEL